MALFVKEGAIINSITSAPACFNVDSCYCMIRSDVENNTFIHVSGIY